MCKPSGQLGSVGTAHGRCDSVESIVVTTQKSPPRETYRAIQAVAPGKLELTEKPLVDPPAGYVRVRIEACGVCHSDAGTVEGVFPIAWPRVPGHEAVGVIDKVGAYVEGWSVGDRVGVGFLGGQLWALCALSQRQPGQLQESRIHRHTPRWRLC